MHSAVSSSVGNGKSEGLPGRVLLLIQVLLALVLGWIGMKALLHTLRESQDRDAATVHEYINARRQEDERRLTAPSVSVKAVSRPVSIVKTRGLIAAPAAKAQLPPAGRHDSGPADQNAR